MTRTKSKTARIRGLRPVTTSSGEKVACTPFESRNSDATPDRASFRQCFGCGIAACRKSGSLAGACRDRLKVAEKMRGTPFDALVGMQAGTLPTTADLVRLFDRPGPRYTSYPTAVEFSQAFDERAYLSKLDQASQAPDEPLSMYLHLPFCQARCSFCGCSVIVTEKRHVAARYLEYLHREIALVAARLRGRRRVVQYHWGGGTPTYLAPEQMEALHGEVLRHFDITPDAERAIEVDPRVTSRGQIDLLRTLGFNRLSIGVQDFSPLVQDAIGRHQSEPATRELYGWAREAGFDSINFDLVYGLPQQTPESFARTVDSVIDLRPDRLAVYSYAHVPWIKGNQKRIRREDLPPAELKFDLFSLAADRFVSAGYERIGMDHFALPGDELALAARERVLHRNFMGYTTRPARDQIGLGVTSIGDVSGAFAQNTKKLSTYYACLDNGRLPIDRGLVLTDEDRIRRYVITQLMCNFRVNAAEVERRFAIPFARHFEAELRDLTRPDGPASYGFVAVDPSGIEVLPRGQRFVRNVCMTFDAYLRRHEARPVFSRTV
jgi:oxygen-independent coproporphyrinogen-3 oxidase